MNQIEIESTVNNRATNIGTSDSNFSKFLCQPAFGTFAKPHKPTQNQSFAKEPSFTHRLNRIITLKEYNYGR